MRGALLVLDWLVNWLVVWFSLLGLLLTGSVVLWFWVDSMRWFAVVTIYCWSRLRAGFWVGFWWLSFGVAVRLVVLLLIVLVRLLGCAHFDFVLVWGSWLAAVSAVIWVVWDWFGGLWLYLCVALLW